MKILTQKELNKLLEQHELWIETENKKGYRLWLKNCNVSGLDLSNRDLTYVWLDNCTFNQANFSGTELKGAHFKGCNLDQLDFSNRNLTDAHFHNCNLNQVNFSGSNLKGTWFYNCNLNQANFSDSNLTDTRFSDCNLEKTNFSGSNLTDAHFCDSNLDSIITDDNTIFKMICPEQGEFIGWKNCRVYDENNEYIDDCIVKLLIPEDAKRSSATGNKCRCSKAKVLGFYNKDGSVYQLPEGWSVRSWWAICNFYIFEYKINEIVISDGFNENRWYECTNGIHFYMNINEVL